MAYLLRLINSSSLFTISKLFTVSIINSITANIFVGLSTSFFTFSGYRALKITSTATIRRVVLYFWLCPVINTPSAGIKYIKANLLAILFQLLNPLESSRLR